MFIICIISSYLSSLDKIVKTNIYLKVRKCDSFYNIKEVILSVTTGLPVV